MKKTKKTSKVTKTKKTTPAKPTKKKPSIRKKQQMLDRRLLNLANETIENVKGRISTARARIEKDMSSDLALSILKKARTIRENLNSKRRDPRRANKR